MHPPTFQNQVIRGFLISLVFWSVGFVSYLFGAHNWAFYLVPFFLIALEKPEKIPFFSLGFLLVLQDVACGYWLGTHLFLYGALAFLVISQKRFILNRGFMLIWFFFVLSTFFVLFFRDLLGLMAGQPPHTAFFLLYESLFLSCFFPLFASFFYFLARRLHRKESRNSET